MEREMSNVRSKYLPTLSPEARARWAYQLSVNVDERRQTVTDESIAHAGTTREKVEALIDSLAEAGGLTVVRSVGGQRSVFSIVGH
jgi:hypothetical protein